METIATKFEDYEDFVTYCATTGIGKGPHYVTDWGNYAMISDNGRVFEHRDDRKLVQNVTEENDLVARHKRDNARFDSSQGA
jgi:hypothetical protein